MRRLRYLLESLLVRAVMRVFRSLTMERAARLGAWWLRRLGPLSGRHRVAKANLARAFPALERRDAAAILDRMWGNIGATLGEFPHLATKDDFIAAGIIEARGLEILDEIDAANRACVFFTGHLANWEMAAKAFHDFGLPLSPVYRRGNNPGLDALIQATRGFYQRAGIAKGKEGAREMLRAARAGRSIGALVDQKMNEGIDAPFFGRPAKTGPAIARLAWRHGCPLVPVQTIRLRGSRHRVILHPPLRVDRSAPARTEIPRLMGEVNGLLEDWIRQRPGQWLWVHRRWGG